MPQSRTIGPNTSSSWFSGMAGINRQTAAVALIHALGGARDDGSYPVLPAAEAAEDNPLAAHMLHWAGSASAARFGCCFAPCTIR